MTRIWDQSWTSIDKYDSKFSSFAKPDVDTSLSDKF